jgi:hypothetical protein
MSEKRFLALLQLLYQGLNLMAIGVKRLIDEIKQESSSQA